MVELELRPRGAPPSVDSDERAAMAVPLRDFAAHRRRDPPGLVDWRARPIPPFACLPGSDLPGGNVPGADFSGTDFPGADPPGPLPFRILLPPQLRHQHPERQLHHARRVAVRDPMPEEILRLAQVVMRLPVGRELDPVAPG